MNFKKSKINYINKLKLYNKKNNISKIIKKILLNNMKYKLKIFKMIINHAYKK